MNWYDSSLRQMADQLFLLDVSPISYLLVFLGGLLTNFCPCNVALIPIVIGFVGGVTGTGQRGNAILYTLVFSSGIVVTLSTLGILAAAVGTFIAPLQSVCLVLVAAVALLMGLYSLDLIKFNLPGLGVLPIRGRKGIWETFLVGLAAGVVATPCTTPVLAVILAYVAVKARLLFGVSLLLVYALGFVVPLIMAATFGGFLLGLKKFQEKTGYSTWIKKGSGILLITFSCYMLWRAIF
jgi:cytochrome c-type biogenesis protein